MTTLCPVCETTGLSTEPRIPPGQPARVIDGADVWLVPCSSHGQPEVAASFAGFQDADGQPIVSDEVPA